MTVFISGGCKNGKSMLAQKSAASLAGGGKLYYVATMIACDEEDRARIRRHLAERGGMGFETLEVGHDILSCLDTADKNGTFLVDSVTALLLNEMFPASYHGEADPGAAARCADGLAAFAGCVKNAVFVSDYIYSDAARYDSFTENYRRSLAQIDRRLAAVCDTVLELCVGNVFAHKGALAL